MTKSKIAISLPKDQIARVHREVRAGRAGSVSGYIALLHRALAQGRAFRLPVGVGGASLVQRRIQVTLARF